MTISSFLPRAAIAVSTVVAALALGTPAAAAAPSVLPAAVPSVLSAAPLRIGTFNTDLQPWLPGQAGVLDVVAATDLDVLALQGVWSDAAAHAILDDPRIAARYPYSYAPPTAQEAGACPAFVPISTQKDFIQAIVDSGGDTREVEQPRVALPNSVVFLGLDLSLTDQPCFAAIVNTMQSFPAGRPPLDAVDLATDGNAPRYAHGGSTGQLVLSRTPISDVSVYSPENFLARHATVYATISGVHLAFADWSRNVLFDIDPQFGPSQAFALQPDYAADVLARAPDVLVGTLNSGPGYQQAAYDTLLAAGYTPRADVPTYCPTGTPSTFAPCQVRQRDAGSALPPDLRVDNVLVRSGARCEPATTFGAAVPASDHVGLATACGRPFPSTAVLDPFARADGTIGASWAGLTPTSFYRLSAKRLDVQVGGPIVWASTGFGAAQEAFVTLSGVDPKGPVQGLLLKVQTASLPTASAISVAYDAPARTVRVTALRVGARSWTAYPPVPVSFAAGDVLGARVLPDGHVEVYRNGALLRSVALTAPDTAFFAGRGGRIGITTVLSPAAVLDDFGGGTIS